MIRTEAWGLARGHGTGPGRLEFDTFTFPDLTEREALVEPLVGCWEANMTHALERRPIDICAERGEDRVVIGNTGVVRVLAVGRDVTGLREGDACMVYGVDPDRRPFGMPARAWAYDEPGSIGLLARRTKLYHRQLILLPPGHARDVRPWAAFSGRYLAAWPNFQLAHATLRAIVGESEYPAPFAWAWGGGVSLAQQELAQLSGYRCAMIASTDRRLALIESKGMTAVDRRKFPDLAYDEKRFASDRAFRKTYLASERMFLATVAELTGCAGASLFFDHIGSPVARATLKAMGCPGVLGTAGWKHGMRVSSVRALECMAWHTHVHTHCTRLRDVHASMAFAAKHNWLPTQLGPPRRFEEIPALAADYARGLDTYFPLYEVNPA